MSEEGVGQVENGGGVEQHHAVAAVEYLKSAPLLRESYVDAEKHGKVTLHTSEM